MHCRMYMFLFADSNIENGYQFQNQRQSRSEIAPEIIDSTDAGIAHSLD